MNDIPQEIERKEVPTNGTTSPRLLNRAAIKKHALEVSKQLRAGKFSRVSEDFFLEVEADIEALVRNISGKYPTSRDTIDPKGTFVTGLLTKRVVAEMNPMIGRMIQSKVLGLPSCGKTIGKTR